VLRGTICGPWTVSISIRRIGKAVKFKLLTRFLDPNSAPVKPELNIVNVNLIGTMYTWKLAVHYFRKQPDTEDRDRCFIITGSMVSWIDSPVRNLFHYSIQNAHTY
jgi:hypothetical protein